MPELRLDAEHTDTPKVIPLNDMTAEGGRWRAAYGFFWAPFSRRLRIQVSGDFLKVVVYKRLIIVAVLVWHWPTGTMNAVSPDHMYFVM